MGIELFVAFISALSITALIIPPLCRWAPALGLTDSPGPRKVHSAPVPLVGGIAMAVGIVVPALLLIEPTQSLWGLLVGVAVLLVFGVWDDRVELGYRPKLLGQALAAAACMIVGDVQIESLTIIAREPLPEIVSWPLTFFFLLGVTNAINLSDGLDGLAGGLTLLCVCGIAVLASASGDTAVTLLALVVAGAILGFLRYNTHPARIFMGDAGSQLLGFTAGVLAILVTQGESTVVSAGLPLLLLGLPMLDTLAVMIRRLREHRSPFSGDRNHLHHRLLALGFAHPEAVLLIYMMQVSLFLSAYFLRFESDLLILLAFGAFAVALLWMLSHLTRAGWRWHDSKRPPLLTRALARLKAVRHADQFPNWAFTATGVAVLAYVALVLAASDRVGVDLGLLCLALLVLVLFGALRTGRSLRSVERAAAYICVALIVYLDQTIGSPAPVLRSLSWGLLALAGVAALLRFWLAPARRFGLTALDVLVVFIALVVPSLPGSVSLPAYLAAGVAKAAILLYVVEMLLDGDFRRAVPRTCLAATLAVIAIRGLIAPAA